MVLLPEDTEMTLAELRQMAARQQHQIEAQQQLLVAKEQRLKFLKQQEARHHNSADQQLDAACLQNLRDTVETQELKLRQLRALRAQVEQQKTNNGNLGTELDSIRALFNEKEKELNLAVNKVEELTRQLDEIRNNNRKNYITSSTSGELENLRRELLYRTKLSEQQNNYICQQRENISLRQKDISLLDQKINELTQRLHRKRLLNEQLASQIHNASVTRNSTSSITSNELYTATAIISVEPLPREPQEPEYTQDDMAAQLHGLHKDDLGEFFLTKSDPKYQTLPYNTKFTLKGKSSEDSLSSSTEDELSTCIPDYPISCQKSTAFKPSHNMCNFSPRPFSSTYNNVPKIVTEEQQTNDKSTTSLSNEMKANVLNEANNRNNSEEKNFDTWTDATNNNVYDPVPSSTTFKSHRVVNEHTKEHSKLATSYANKPAVPPKPTIPIKPTVSLRPVPTTPIIESVTEESDLVDAALSVLQNKSSSKEKNAFSNYRERLLYYRCIPGYGNQRDGSQDANNGNKIATYFPKVTQLDKNFQVPKQIENSDSNDILKRKPSQLPIKPKPLTIRKSPGLEPPKLKIQQLSNSGLYRKTADVLLHAKTSIDATSFLIKSSDDKNPDNSKSYYPQDLMDNVPKERDEFSNNMHEEEAFVTLSDDAKHFKQDAALEFWESDQPKEFKETDIKIEEDNLKLDVTEETPDASSSSEDYEVSHTSIVTTIKKGNLKGEGAIRSSRRVSFDPLALLLDAALEGELELVKKTANEVANPSAANDEGITALHNAICAGHFEVVTFLVEFGCDVNSQDSDGWTPLHCAASCNNLPMVKFLIERGACIFATTLSDHETAAEKCEEDEEGFDGCSEYLYNLQENLGVMNGGIVYAVYDYEVQNADELSFKNGDVLTVLRKGDDEENEWWWSKLLDAEGYVPRNLLGLFPRVNYQKEST